MHTKKWWKKKSLEYHNGNFSGKLKVMPLKSISNQEEYSLAYTPGVAFPCLEIAKNKNNVYKYTSKGNTMAVISNGTSVLGLGNIGPEAGKPVMEGKAVLLKKFAGIDAYDLCIGKTHNEKGQTNVKEFVSCVEKLEPSLGAINLEDIRAPDCFEIEKQLIERMSIPVMHDDQHGTAVVVGAALINSLKLAEKKFSEIKIVFSGAGAAGIACARFCKLLGVKKENLILCDSKGVLFKGRNNLDEYKKEFAIETNARTLADALKDADVFIGVSQPNLVSKKMISFMADKAIVFAMSNPVPEIMPEKALKAGAFIVGTGRSDRANQINNVMAFPGLYRGALDTMATKINEEMKLAASKALAGLLEEKIPKNLVKELYKMYPRAKEKHLFEHSQLLAPGCILPRVLDPRVVPRIARAVVQAAMKTNVARKQIDDLENYEKATQEFIKFTNQNIQVCLH